MQDKTFLHAIQDLPTRISDQFHESYFDMLLKGITATRATARIESDMMRSMINDTLIIGQIIALLEAMKEMQILGETQYREFTTHLLGTLSPEQVALLEQSSQHLRSA